MSEIKVKRMLESVNHALKRKSCQKFRLIRFVVKCYGNNSFALIHSGNSNTRLVVMSFTRPVVRYFIRLFVRGFNYSFVRTIIHSYILSLVHSSLLSFHSFLHSFHFCQFFSSFVRFFFLLHHSLPTSLLLHYFIHSHIHVSDYPFAVCSNIRCMLVSCCGMEILGHSRTKIFIRERKEVRGCFLIFIFHSDHKLSCSR